MLWALLHVVAGSVAIATRLPDSHVTEHTEVSAKAVEYSEIQK